MYVDSSGLMGLGFIISPDILELTINPGYLDTIQLLSN